MTVSHLNRTFGGFLVKEPLGAGGAGEVYLAEQVALGREAVIKVVSATLASSRGAQERFLREARLASKLDHPFAAHVYAFGAESDGTLWIAMELVRGTPLDRLIQTQGPVTLARFVPLLERLCEVLNAAHEQDIVHRDIKPANVMVLQRAGKLLPKLLDLGIARTAQQDFSPSSDGGAFPEAEVRGTATPSLPAETASGSNVQVSTMSGSLAGRLTRSESMHLTQVGSVVGTPHYMAPEQWADASRAGAKADIYSLAILAFQCLTGKLPFKSKSLMGMAKAHASQPLPPLPEGLPEALHAVLAKGAAKKAEDRYATPLEFAAALRGASGLGVEPVSLPQLDEGLRDNLLSEAPQPLAEAVASLEGARTAKRAVEATSMVLRILCRYLGIVALAARVRVGPGGVADALNVTGLLTKLRDTGLSDAEWLELARHLVAPFRSKHEAHPLPEVVRYFADHADEGVDSLLQVSAPSKDANEHASMQHLLNVVPKLGAVLERVAFLFDYTLVVQASVPERWTGTRRLERLPVVMVTPAKKGDVVLVDAVGTAVVTLPPLLQCIAPSGGAPEEMFLLEGPGRHGAKLVAHPSPFERQDESLWQWMVQQGLLPEATGAAVATEKVPYKGLSTFSSDDADNYFGREKEAEAFANRMRKESFLAVVGPSGTGKSSFILAGVLPLLPKGWKPVVMRPGATPTLPKEVSEDFGEGHLVLVVDQFEELVTLCQDSARRSSFATQLLELSRHSSGRVRVVVTLRDDFLIKVQQLPAFRETLSNSLQLLGTPAPEDLQRVVTEPARRVGYAFDDAQLPKRMVEAVSEYPGALALLSFTASQLWELRDRHLRLMRVKTYDALGGVGGALANHAEATLASLNAEEQKLVREAFRHFVTAQGTRAVLTKQEALEVLGGTQAASTVLEKLVTARLLVSSETADGNDSIEVIHEALITAWPRLVGWQREDAESARLRDSLRASARQWEERGRPSGLLWRKETLTEYRVWRARFPGRLTQLEASFAAASLRDEARAQLIRRSLAVAAFVALTVGLIVIFRAYRAADGSATESLQRMRDMRVEQARLAVLDGQPFPAATYGEEARRLGTQSQELNVLEQVLAQRLGGAGASVFSRSVSSVVLSPGGRRVAVIETDGSLTILSMPDLRVEERRPREDSLPSSFAFIGDDDGVVCRKSGEIETWIHGEGLTPLARVLSLSDCVPTRDGRLYAIDLGGRLHRFVFSVQGASVSQHDTTVLGVRLTHFKMNAEHTLAAAFQVGSSTGDPVPLLVIDAETMRIKWRFTTGRSRDTDVAFDHTSQRLVAGNIDGVAREFDLQGGTALRELRGHTKTLVSVAYDGPNPVTASRDGDVRVWSPQGQSLRVLAHDSTVEEMLVLENRIFTRTSSGAVEVWLPGLSSPAHRFQGHAAGLAAFALSKAHLVTAGSEGSIRAWPLETCCSETVPIANGLTYVAPNPTRTRAIAGPDGRSLSLVDFASRRTETHQFAADACDPDGALAAHFATPDAPTVVMSQAAKACWLDWRSKELWQFDPEAGRIVRLSFDSSGGRVLAAGSDGVSIFDVNKKALVRRWPLAQRARGASFSLDETRVYAGTDDGLIHCMKIDSGDSCGEIHAHQRAVLAVIATKLDGAEVLLSSSSDQTAAIWDPATGKLLKRFTGHSETISWLDLNPDGRTLATVDWGGELRLWDVESERCVSIQSLGGATNDVFWTSPTQIVTELGTEAMLRFVDVLAPAAPLSECSNPLHMVNQVIVARDGWGACRSIDAP